MKTMYERKDLTRSLGINWLGTGDLFEPHGIPGVRQCGGCRYRVTWTCPRALVLPVSRDSHSLDSGAGEREGGGRASLSVLCPQGHLFLVHASWRCQDLSAQSPVFKIRPLEPGRWQPAPWGVAYTANSSCWDIGCEPKPGGPGR
uniref:Uncharacterized protein n=1 Tax=Myotis myotis TaxID=51298 RepID=A0A7J7XH44_MYOMY|nr:hypothetical protein mMyoMyo1_011614 [Myotis myotis]